MILKLRMDCHILSYRNRSLWEFAFVREKSLNVSDGFMWWSCACPFISGEPLNTEIGYSVQCTEMLLHVCASLFWMTVGAG